MRQDHTTKSLVLLVMSGPAQGQRIPLDHSFILGRDTSSKILFDDERISRHHSMVELVDGEPCLRDLDSKNGTFVNGMELKALHHLKAGDRIRLGQTLLGIYPLGAAEVRPAVSINDTDADLETDLQCFRERQAHTPTPMDGNIQRSILRRATKVAARIAVKCQEMEPLQNILSLIKSEFPADGVFFFLGEGRSDPICNVGGNDSFQDVVAELGSLMAGGTFPATILPPPSHRWGTGGDRESYLAFFIRLRNHRPSAFLLQRRGEAFSEAEASFGDALSECLRIVPLDEYFRIESARFTEDQLSLIVGSSEAMQAVRKEIRSFAATPATVLVYGESGTGKELCARAIAQLSDRRHGPYVEVNSACINPELLESELFGHEKGAFTGATERKSGKLEIADGGTLFLDEIGELSLDLQAKLLRVLEGQPFYRVGGGRLIQANVRFICATNRDLEKMVNKGTFRRDFYHRINILKLEIPPLRKRLEDIPDLVNTFLGEIQEDLGINRQFTMTPRGLRRLLSHDWPGNVRELKNVLHRMAILSNSDELDDIHVPTEIGHDEDSSTTMKLPRLQVLTEMIEREEISRALVEANGQKATTARLLGISRPTLDKKIRVYGLGALLHGRVREAIDPDQSD